MTEVFVDTSAWYPLVVSNHPDHPAIAASLREVLKAGARLVTTNLVVMETHALLLHRANRSIALEFARTVGEPPTVVVASSRDVELAAISTWIARFEDQDFSLADGVSFATMKARGISQALALDSHFAAAGFRMLPAPRQRRRGRSS